MGRMARYLLLLPLALAACTSRADALAPLVGQSEQVLIQKFGVPDQQIHLNGHDYLAYTDLVSTFYPSGPVAVLYHGGYTVNFFQCQKTFDVVNGRVVGFSLHGHAC
jgi:hypothetical protein